MKGFEMPAQETGLSAEDRAFGMETYAELKDARQRAAEQLAKTMDQADELGLDLNNDYDSSLNSNPERAKIHQQLVSDRAQLGLFLESNDALMQRVEKALEITRPHDA